MYYFIFYFFFVVQINVVVAFSNETKTIVLIALITGPDIEV